MRIITGKAKHIQLVSYDKRTRPLSDRAKMALFSIIHEKIPDSTVLDLYAGTGALGIECLSRGAKHATFVDISKKSFFSIEENLQKTHFEDEADIVKEDVEEYLAHDASDTFDIIFVCPPYPKVKFKIVQMAAELLTPYGILIFEHHKKDKFNPLESLQKVDEREYGIVHFDIYQNLKN